MTNTRITAPRDVALGCDVVGAPSWRKAVGRVRTQAAAEHFGRVRARPEDVLVNHWRRREGATDAVGNYEEGPRRQLVAAQPVEVVDALRLNLIIAGEHLKRVARPDGDDHAGHGRDHDLVACVDSVVRDQVRV